jgi:DegV family protein with EDD domain
MVINVKRIVATTSTSCLDYVKLEDDIRTIRIKIDLDGKLLKDGSELKADYFYQRINEDSTLVPKTTMPSLGELLDFFEGLADEGYEEVICTTISSKLSGTYNGIVQVAQMLEDRIKIYPFDTKTVCFNEGYFAVKASQMIKEGIDTKEIINKLSHMRESNKIFFAVDSLEYLVKNGRLSGAAGFLGKFFKIKPILELFPDGTIQAVEKIRTTKKALEGACDRLKEYIEGHKYRAWILYTGPELKEFLISVLKEHIGLENLEEYPCTPVVGCHVGGNAIGIGVFLED